MAHTPVIVVESNETLLDLAALDPKGTRPQIVGARMTDLAGQIVERDV